MVYKVKIFESLLKNFNFDRKKIENEISYNNKHYIIGINR